jgi:hypothetical protein
MFGVVSQGHVIPLVGVPNELFLVEEPRHSPQYRARGLPLAALLACQCSLVVRAAVSRCVIPRDVRCRTSRSAMLVAGRQRVVAEDHRVAVTLMQQGDSPATARRKESAWGAGWLYSGSSMHGADACPV